MAIARNRLRRPAWPLHGIAFVGQQAYRRPACIARNRLIVGQHGPVDRLGVQRRRWFSGLGQHACTSNDDFATINAATLLLSMRLPLPLAFRRRSHTCKANRFYRLVLHFAGRSRLLGEKGPVP